MNNERCFYVFSGITLFAVCVLLLAIPKIFEATLRAWPGAPLPSGLIAIHNARLGLLVVPIFFFACGIAAKRYRCLASPVMVVLLAGIALLLLVFSALMLCTPIILHGSLLGTTDNAHLLFSGIP
jgi:hypothetical protein